MLLPEYRKKVIEIVKDVINTKDVLGTISPNAIQWKDYRVSNDDCKNSNIMYLYHDGKTENLQTVDAARFNFNLILGFVKPDNEMFHITNDVFDDIWGQISISFTERGMLKQYTRQDDTKFCIGDYGVFSVRSSGGDRMIRFGKCGAKRVEMLLTISCNFLVR